MIRLMGSVLIEIHEKWVTGTKYFIMESNRRRDYGKNHGIDVRHCISGRCHHAGADSGEAIRPRDGKLLVGIMALVLGIGDAFHLIPRVYALNAGGPEAHAALLGARAG